MDLEKLKGLMAAC